MKIWRNVCAVGLLVILCAFTVNAQEHVYWDVVQKIRAEEFHHSQIMETVSYLSDVFGPRLANSPSYQAAAEWAKERLEEYGLSHAKLEPYGDFGVTWRNDYTSVHMMTPQYMPVIAYPNTWSAGTHGKVTGSAVYINIHDITTRADLEKYRGKLQNAIVLTEPKREISPDFEPMAVRYTDKQLEKMAETDIRALQRERRRREMPSNVLSREKIIDFLFSEGAAAVAAPDERENYGTVLVNEVPGKAWESRKTVHPPFLVISAEQYNRIMRILEKGIPVEMEVELKISITEDDRTDYNVIAEIPGTDLADEVVIIGGHLDANSAGTGATDNASGASVAMEAARILKAIGVRPRRTIRVALWGGEEYGLLGSRGYIARHYGDPETQQWLPDHAKVAAYFNRDGGGGRIRGIGIQENEGVRPIFTEWMKPLHDLGVSILVSESSWSSDHASFDAAGLPGFDFVQDPIERRAYHTNMDVFDRLVPEDMMQSAVVMATFAYHAAMRDARLPRIAPSRERMR